MRPTSADDVALFVALGRTHIPMPISQWRELTMATKSIGRATVKGNKVKMADTAPTHARIAKKKKADRTEARLRKNREKAR